MCWWGRGERSGVCVCMCVYISHMHIYMVGSVMWVCVSVSSSQEQQMSPNPPSLPSFSLFLCYPGSSVSEPGLLCILKGSTLTALENREGLSQRPGRGPKSCFALREVLQDSSSLTCRLSHKCLLYFLGKLVGNIFSQPLETGKADDPHGVFPGLKCNMQDSRSDVKATKLGIRITSPPA